MLPALLSAVAPILQTIIERIPDENHRIEATRETEIKLQALLAEQDNQQISVNKIEAAHPDLFVAGWRPFIGWVCGTALLYHYIMAPLLVWVIAVCQLGNTPLPTINSDALFELVLAMLGMGGLRTYEKIRGIERQAIKKP